MALRARVRWTRWTAALLAVAALVPALHHALSHTAFAASGLEVTAAPRHAGTSLPETCPICLASKLSSAVLTASRTPGMQAAALPAPLERVPHAASGFLPGAASPRAPPSA